jgi:hypothetical protein
MVLLCPPASDVITHLSSSLSSDRLYTYACSVELKFLSRSPGKEQRR